MWQVCRIHRVIGYLKQTRRCYASHRGQDYYKILGVEAGASKEDIRAAFLNLSKKVHPDTGNTDGHADFVKVTEAYNVLSKDYSRREYDAKLKHSRNYYHHASYYPPHRTVYHNRESRFEDWRDTQSRTHGARPDDRNAFYNNNNPYEVNGQKKFSNLTIVLFCILTSAIGLGLQVFAVAASPTFNRKKMLERSEVYNAELEKIRGRVKNHSSLSESIDTFFDNIDDPDDE